MACDAPGPLQAENIRFDAIGNRLVAVLLSNRRHKDRSCGRHSWHRPYFSQVLLFEKARPTGAVQSHGGGIIRTSLGHNQYMRAKTIQFLSHPRVVSGLESQEAEE